MRHVDTIPDWAILLMAVLVVAGVYSLFGGFGVLVIGIVATAIWIAQIARMHRSSQGRRIAPIATATNEDRHAAP
jgi:hypothetical protein